MDVYSGRYIRANAGHILTENDRLGSTTKYTSTFDKKHRYEQAYKMLNAAQGLLAEENHRVCICCRNVIPGEEYVSLNVDSDKKSASFAGTMKCSNVWGCPVCSSRISEQRRIELESLIREAKSQGYRVAMLTATTSHNKAQSLIKVRSLFAKTWARFTGGRWWKEAKQDWGIVGTVRSLETPYGEHGWHVHAHFLIIYKPTENDYDFPVSALEKDCKLRWVKAAAAVGTFATLEHGLKITQNESEISAYVTKFGHLPTHDKSKEVAVSADEQGWNESHELAKQVSKKSRSDKGRTPFQLLQDYVHGDKQAGALFVEYVLAMKHQKQLVYSNGLKELFTAEEEKTDAEIANENEPETVVEIDRHLWREIVRQKARGRLLDMALEDRDKLHVELSKIAGKAFTPSKVVCEKIIKDYKVQVRVNSTGLFDAVLWRIGSNRRRPDWTTSLPVRTENEALFIGSRFAHYHSER